MYAIFSIVTGSIIVLIAITLIVLYFMQERLIFQPEKLPKDFTYHFEIPYEELNFKVNFRITLNAILFKAVKSKGLVIYFHGNAGSIASWGHRANDFVENGYDLLVYDYRGYGKSNGIIKMEKVMHSDAEFIYQEMLKKYTKENIIFFGSSLGTGIAARLASKHQPPQLILNTPYFNFKHVVKFHYPFLPVSLILKYRFESNKFIRKVKCPVNLIHGTNDELVPYESSVLLSQIDPEKINLTTVQGAMHGNISEFKEYKSLIKRVLV